MRILRNSVLAFFAIACSSLWANSQFKSLEWQILESSDSVEVYGRGVKDRPRAREIKAITRVSQSPETLLALMVDYPNATTWRQRVKEVSKVKIVNENSWFINYVTDLPWPLDDRVAYLKCQVIRDQKSGSVIYAFESAPSEDGLSAQESLSGQYKFVPLLNGETEVTYEVILDSPVKAPDWLVNALIGDSFLAQMEMLKDAVANPRYMAAD
ncbi:MAG: hypothetical protein JKY01_03640 [Pseudomonadales bacterium]|nr:hypothetical protein [Pseudomonadales bacterium]